MPLKAPKYVVSSFARFQLQQTVLILLTPAIKYQTTVRVKKIISQNIVSVSIKYELSAGPTVSLLGLYYG
jgi:hypothetical protein